MATSRRNSQTHSLRSGIAHWMQRVLDEVDNVGTELAADPVHDLRVALRRCRTIGEAFRELDPDPAWQEMRKRAKAVFDPLGALRDVQVMLEWLEELGSPDDQAVDKLRTLFTDRESVLKKSAADALQQFDIDQWNISVEGLAARAEKLQPGDIVYQYLALERWQTAHRLHHSALRNRSKTAFHQLRIGLKHFRYIVENFLPERHEEWGDDLKQLQDLLGEVHDLDVLWDTALEARVFPESTAREVWRAKIVTERTQRLNSYRAKMVGPKSLWGVWRAGLPQGPELDKAIIAMFRAWASFRDPDPAHSERVAQFAIALYDGLAAGNLLSTNTPRFRQLLECAANMHEVGRYRTQKSHHKRAAKLIAKLEPPDGWGSEDMLITALTARYHCGSLPRPEHKLFQQLSVDHQLATRQLAGILRLADALDRSHDGSITRLDVARDTELLIIYADGYDPNHPDAENISAARHLLETTCNFPIVIRPFGTAK